MGDNIDTTVLKALIKQANAEEIVDDIFMDILFGGGDFPGTVVKLAVLVEIIGQARGRAADGIEFARQLREGKNDSDRVEGIMHEMERVEFLPRQSL